MTSPNDGSVSLREAITAVNAGTNVSDPDIIVQTPAHIGSRDTINFNISGSRQHRIAVGSSASAAHILCLALSATAGGGPLASSTGKG